MPGEDLAKSGLPIALSAALDGIAKSHLSKIVSSSDREVE